MEWRFTQRFQRLEVLFPRFPQIGNGRAFIVKARAADFLSHLLSSHRGACEKGQNQGSRRGQGEEEEEDVFEEFNNKTRVDWVHLYWHEPLLRAKVTFGDDRNRKTQKRNMKASTLPRLLSHQRRHRPGPRFQIWIRNHRKAAELWLPWPLTN